MKKFILIALAAAALLTAGAVYAAQPKVSAINPSINSSTAPVMVGGYGMRTTRTWQPSAQFGSRTGNSFVQRGNMMYPAQQIGSRNLGQPQTQSRGSMFTGAAVFVLFVISTIMLWVLMLLAIIALFKWIKKQD